MSGARRAVWPYAGLVAVLGGCLACAVYRREIKAARGRVATGSSDFLFWLAIRTSRTLMIRSILGTPPEVVNNANAAEQAKVATTLELILPVAPRRLGLLNDAAVVSSLARYEPRDIKVPLLAISMVDDLLAPHDL